MLDTNVRDRNLNDVGSVGDPCNPFVAPKDCEPLSHGLVQRVRPLPLDIHHVAARLSMRNSQLCSFEKLLLMLVV
jgi:hypothetical protein